VAPGLLIAVLVVALLLGLIANRWVRPFAKSEVQGVKLELLVGPLMTLTVVLLSFVLVQVYASFVKTRDAAGEEAGKVSVEYDLAGYFPERYALPLQASLVCYARSIVDIEWPELAGDRALAPAVALWANNLDVVFTRLASERNSQPYGTILTVDRERAEARTRRLTEAQPTVPSGLMVLMVSVGCAAIFAFGAFTLPYVSRRVQIGALCVLVIVFAGLLLTLRDLDEKYEGWSRVDPDDMHIAERLVTDKFARDHPGAELPCDASGRRLGGATG
jgi:hypothetical protein